MATDFRNGLFPRRGRDEYHGWLWLQRVFDKGRASHHGTIHDYIYPCGMDKGVFQRWGITPEAFDAALTTATSIRRTRSRIDDSAGSNRVAGHDRNTSAAA